MAADIFPEYQRRLREARDRIVAEHPRMALPYLAGPLASQTINEVAPWLTAQKRTNRRAS